MTSRALRQHRSEVPGGGEGEEGVDTLPMSCDLPTHALLAAQVPS